MKISVLSILLLVLNISISYSQDLSKDLLFYYPFSNNTKDSSSNNIDAVLYGATSITDNNGKSNSAYSFDGKDDYIEVPYSSKLKVDFPVTISFWVNKTDFSVGNNRLYSSDFLHDNYAGYWIGVMTTGEIECSFGGNIGGAGSGQRRTKISNTALKSGVWHHVACVINGANDMKIFIDCKDAGGTYSGGGPTNVGHSMKPGRIGSNGGNILNSDTLYFKGQLDEFAFWGRALNQNELESLCNGISLSKNKMIAEISNSMKVFPNPVDDLLNIEISDLGSKEYIVDVFNTSGQLVMSDYITTNKTVLDFADFPNGVYYLKVYSKDSSFSTKLIVR